MYKGAAEARQTVDVNWQWAVEYKWVIKCLRANCQKIL